MRVDLQQRTREIARQSNAHATWTERSWCEVRLYDSEGHTGRGLAAPLPGYSDETLDDACAELERFAAFVAQDSFSTEVVSRALRKTPVMLPSTRFAIEMATLELRAKHEGTTGDALLARTAEQPNAERVRVALWLRDDDPLERVTDAVAVKIKIGRSLQQELQRVAAVRARNPSAEIRVDANRALDPAMVSDVAGAFAHMGVDCLEEPCDPEHLLTMHTLPIGLAFDETLTEARGFSLLKEVRVLHRLRALSIKPTRLGDIKNTLFWCQNAIAWSAAPVISHCLEPDRGYRALLAWASLFPDVIHGLGPHGALAEEYKIRDGAIWRSDIGAAWLAPVVGEEP